MKASGLQAYLRSLDRGWIDSERTVDTFKAGDPETEITGIAVGWQSYTWSLKEALNLGCNVFLTHEPTYYNHLDSAEDDRYTRLPGFVEKKSFIESTRLVVIRCHDLLDQMPGWGITDSWAAALGLPKLVAKDPFRQVFEVEAVRAIDFARRVATVARHYGQGAVEFIGPERKTVRRVAIGTGALSSLFDYLRSFEIDLAVCADDANIQWRDGEYAIDQGIPVVVVNHAVSEEMGVRNLANHLRERFPRTPVHHIPQGCTYSLVSA